MSNVFQGMNRPNPYQPTVNWNSPSANQYIQMPQQQFGYVNQRPIQPTNRPMGSNIPVRVVFSPDQISPQEIPTDGSPAIFPLNDGKSIIVRFLGQNGMFEESVYTLQPKNMPNDSSQPAPPSEFEQVMMRLGSIEQNLNQILGDLYGSKNQTVESEGKGNE